VVDGKPGACREDFKIFILSFFHDKNWYSDHLFDCLTIDVDIDIDCGDTIDSNIVATTRGNTNDAISNVDGKLQEMYRIRFRIRACSGNLRRKLAP